MTLTPENRYRLLKNITRLIELNYVFGDHVDEVVAQFEAIQLSKLDQPKQLASKLTQVLYDLTNDGHLLIYYDPEEAEQLKWLQNHLLQSQKPLPKAQSNANRPSSGIRNIARLIGEIGYIDFEHFLATTFTGTAITSAFHLVSGCQALILDVRQNLGGQVSVVQWLASYLLDEPRLLHLYQDTRTDFQQQVWSYPFVPGTKYTQPPVYILVSANTFSAAEEFTYDLQAIGRATVVGEPTGGGAHLTEQHVAGYGFIVNIPVARVVNPITDTNWQGRGITPNIICQSDTALETAHLHALETLLQQETDPARKAQLQWNLETVGAVYHPLKLNTETLPRFMGEYEGRSVTIQGEDLYLRHQHTSHKLIPLSSEIFYVAHQDQLRVEFLVEGEQVTGMLIKQPNDPESIFIPKMRV